MPIFTFMYDCLCQSTAGAHDVVIVFENTYTSTGSILGLDLEVIVAHLGATPKGKDWRTKMIPTLKSRMANPPDARSYGNYDCLFRCGIALWYKDTVIGAEAPSQALRA